MSKAIADSIVELFRPQTPLWACELTSRHVVVAGVTKDRSKVRTKLATALPADSITSSLSSPNIRNREAVRSIVLETLTSARFEGSEIAVILPDDAARIAFLNVENLSKDAGEQETFIRWKLKKTVPFDVDAAQIGYRVIGPHSGGTGFDLMVTLSPRTIVEEYENLFQVLDIQAGLVLPSTIAALNLVKPSSRDALLLKIAPDCITTTIFQHGRIQFYRRILDVALYDAVYPTVMYYQDKLGGAGLEQVIVCGYGSEDRVALADVQEKLGIPFHRLEPKGIDDIFKPAFGAVHLLESAL